MESNKPDYFNDKMRERTMNMAASIYKLFSTKADFRIIKTCNNPDHQKFIFCSSKLSFSNKRKIRCRILC